MINIGSGNVKIKRNITPFRRIIQNPVTKHVVLLDQQLLHVSLTWKFINVKYSFVGKHPP